MGRKQVEMQGAVPAGTVWFPGYNFYPYQIPDGIIRTCIKSSYSNGDSFKNRLFKVVRGLANLLFIYIGVKLSIYFSCERAKSELLISYYNISRFNF